MKRRTYDQAAPILTAEQQFQNAFASFPQPDQEQEQTLIARAQSGEPLRDEIILSLQRQVYTLATKYLRPTCHLDRMDLIQAANVAMCQGVTRALQHANPMGYLLTIARRTMIDCVNGRGDLIKTYRYEDRITTISLDQPLCEDGLSFADLLPAEVQADKAPHKCTVAIEALLHQAIETLPEKQRMVIQQHYGFHTQPESLNAISQILAPQTHCPSNAHYYHKIALKALRQQLASLLPQYAEVCCE